MRLTISMLASLALLAGCTTVPLPPKPMLSDSEREAVCALTSDIDWGPFGNVEWEEDRERIAILSAWANPAEFKPLPGQLRCGSDYRRLHASDGETPFDRFWLADDGRRAIVAGGFLGGPQLGWGGECHYTREEAGWQRIGCVMTYQI
jgi:hypothetical protein